MKVRITDLLDSYEDESVRLAPMNAQQDDRNPDSEKETREVKQSKHRFGVKEWVAIAAAAAVVILGGFGLIKLLNGENRTIQATDNPDPSTVMTSSPEDLTEDLRPEETRDYAPIDYDFETLCEINRQLTFVAEQNIEKLDSYSDEFTLVSFAHRFVKLHPGDEWVITELTVEGESYEMLPLDRVNAVLTDLLGLTVDPTKNAEYTEENGLVYDNGAFYQDGRFWFPAEENESPSVFAVCTGAYVDHFAESDAPPVSINFVIYEVASDLTRELIGDEGDYSRIMADEANGMAGQGLIRKIGRGTAKLLPQENWRIVNWDAQPITQTVPVSLDSLDFRATANAFLTKFAEQGITQLDSKEADPYTLVSFAHLYYKLNEPGQIIYREMDGSSYETLGIGQVNGLLLQMLDTTVDVPDGTDFTEQRGDNYAQHEIFKDGFFWFPAADGDQHTAFAVCERVRDNSDGTYTLEYRVYDLTHPEDYEVPDKTAAFAMLSVADVEGDEQFELIMCGAAIVRVHPDEPQLLWLNSLHASWVDPASLENEELDPSVQESVNSQLSRFAELDITDLNEMKQDDGALLRYALHLAKLDQSDARFPVTVQTRNGEEYLTMKLSDVNWLLGELLLNVSVDPEEGAEFACPLQSDHLAKGFAENGVVWFPSGEDFTYPNFVVCDGGHTAAYEVTWADGTITDTDCLFVSFRVYEAALDDYRIRDYCKLSAAEAEAMAENKTIYLVEKGTAVILPAGSGQILDYHVTWIEPEGWEEEFPQEYPITEWRIEGEGFRQSGEINLYRYEQLPEAEHYVDILTGIAREELNAPDASFEPDSQHDGYANWSMSAGSGSASISGSSITGRFTYNLYPGFTRILEQSEAEITDRAAMEAAARAFVDEFAGITGELELAGSRDEEEHYHDERFSGLHDVVVPAVIYYFRSAEHSRVTLTAQDGLEVPVTCGDSTIDDLSDHVFAVTVWPDGTVVTGDNYVTKAVIVSDGTMEMPGKDSLDEIASFLTSFTENDALIVESAALEEYSVYFGHGEIDPVLTVYYHFASSPDEHESTMIVIPGLLD